MGRETIGRDEEIKRLTGFLNSNEQFEIGIITGNAGSGKSRLVYELCSRIITKFENEWEIFCIDSKMLDEPEVWEVDFILKDERKSVLIVIDYVLNNVERIGKWINSLRRKI